MSEDSEQKVDPATKLDIGLTAPGEGPPTSREKPRPSVDKKAESIALAQLLQLEEDGKRQEELHDRARAQMAQDEADVNTTAEEWINFFQQEADDEIPDICQDTSQYGWRTSGSG
eukprot:1289924-Heterocapsa_arctica.AAC.1